MPPLAPPPRSLPTRVPTAILLAIVTVATLLTWYCNVRLREPRSERTERVVGRSSPSSSSSSPRRQWNPTPPPLSRREIDDALSRLSVLRDQYDAADRLDDFALRGVGYLSDAHGLAPTLRFRFSSRRRAGEGGKDDDDGDGGGGSGGGSGGSEADAVIFIDDANLTNADYCDPSRFTIWVRVRGPEMFAGSANPSSSSGGKGCSWTFPVNFTIAGTYVAEAKILSVDGDADFDNRLCRTTTRFDSGGDFWPDVREDETRRRRRREAVRGFKFYDPALSCCEICTRLRGKKGGGCVRWSSPSVDEDGYFPSKVASSKKRMDCDLYFEDDGGDGGASFRNARNATSPPPLRRLRRVDGVVAEDRERRRRTADAGRWGNGEGGLRAKLYFAPVSNAPGAGFPRNETKTSYFAGCGWSFWHTGAHPCLNPDDDLLHGSGATLVVVVAAAGKEDEEGPGGRTTGRVGPSVPYGSAEEYLSSNEHASLPHCAAPRDEKAGSGTGRWIREPFPDASACPIPMRVDPNFSQRFKIYVHDDDRPLCSHRENLTDIGSSCIQTQCKRHYNVAVRNQWTSDLKREETGGSRWYGSYRPFGCRYREFTRHELQRCVTDRRITSVRVVGASVAAFLERYLAQRLDGISFYDGTAAVDDNNDGPKAVTATLHTLSLLHLLWHASLQSAERALERSFPNATEHDKGFFLTGFYFTSEREPHATAVRAIQFANVARDVLRKKGWTPLKSYDMSASFAYDAAAQMDGMHLVGPPMKMVVVKFFHYLCA